MAHASNEQEEKYSTVLNQLSMATMKDRLEPYAPDRWRSASNQLPASIFKVLPIIRQTNMEAFEPQIASFGPYHHEKDRLKGMQAYKWRCLHKFVERNPNKSVEDYHDNIKQVADLAKKCYWDDVRMEDEPFVEMLVLDGSFIIELMLMIQWDDHLSPIAEIEWAIPFLLSDMVMLENQIPFFVLKRLYEMVKDVEGRREADYGSGSSVIINMQNGEDDSRSGSSTSKMTGIKEERILGQGSVGDVAGDVAEQAEEHYRSGCSSAGSSVDNGPLSISLFDLAFKFVRRCFWFDSEGMRMPSPEKDIYHFLHFFHSCIIPEQLIGCPQNPQNGHGIVSGLNRLKHVLVNFVSKKLKNTKQEHDNETDEESGSTINEIAIPTTQELIEAGIKFKAKGGGVLEAAFSSGVLEMTPLTIEDNTSTIFHNLIIFEQYCPRVGSHVTGYVVFLDCLIDTAADVKVLRQNGIIENILGSDKEAALVVNRMGQQLKVSDHQLTEMFTKVRQYCRSRWPRWRATLAHDYFSNPWVIISLVAAIVLLFLSGTQTVFSILSYVHPPK